MHQPVIISDIAEQFESLYPLSFQWNLFSYTDTEFAEVLSYPIKRWYNQTPFADIFNTEEITE